MKLSNLFLVLLILILFFPTNSLAHTSGKINWEEYRSNSILYGQVTGCLMRFKLYSELSASEKIKKSTIDIIVNRIVGDVDGHLGKLYQLGKESGHFGGSPKHWIKMMSQLSKEELKNNMAWLQTLTCYKILIDHNFTF